MFVSMLKKVCAVSSFALLVSGAFAADLKDVGPNGSVGVGTYSTQAEYKDIKVVGADGKAVYESGELKDMKGWVTSEGEWKVKDGALAQSGSPEGNISQIILDKPMPAEYTLTMKARKTGGDEGFLILFRAKGFPDGERCCWNLGGWGNTQTSLDGAEYVVDDLKKDDPAIDSNKWYNIKVEVSAKGLRCSLNDRLVYNVDKAGKVIEEKKTDKPADEKKGDKAADEKKADK
jgi:hypothetical protein